MLKMRARGFTDREIGEEVGISRQAVSARWNVMRKAGIIVPNALMGRPTNIRKVSTSEREEE